MTTDIKQLNLFGLATRAGMLLTGESGVLEGVRKGKVHYVVMATDCSIATKKKLVDKCHYYKVPYIEQFTTMEISQAIGKKRSIIGFLDKGFATSFQKYADKEHSKK